MILSDREIRLANERHAIWLTPFPLKDSPLWSPTTVDLTLDAELRVWDHSNPQLAAMSSIPSVLDSIPINSSPITRPRSIARPGSSWNQSNSFSAGLLRNFACREMPASRLVSRGRAGWRGLASAFTSRHRRSTPGSGRLRRAVRSASKSGTLALFECGSRRGCRSVNSSSRKSTACPR